MNDVDPDYVIAGETNTYNYQTILKAVDLVNKGARLIATNSDLTGPSEQGIIPACRALVAPIELATGKTAYYVGKPNPLMMRTGLRLLGVHSHEAAMVGDRMDTDIVAGIETGLDAVLVLSGCTSSQGCGELRLPAALYPERRGRHPARQVTHAPSAYRKPADRRAVSLVCADTKRTILCYTGSNKRRDRHGGTHSYSQRTTRRCRRSCRTFSAPRACR